MSKNNDIKINLDEYRDIFDSVYLTIHEKEVLVNDLKNVLNEEMLEYSQTDRPTPKYIEGYLDKPFIQGGVPVRPKDKLVYDTIMNENFGLVEVEGGVRGGKDVICLLSVSRKLMVSPDPIALVLGSSLEHALRTVLMAGGFGLFYTIPHGVFIRESVAGAQRGVYKFKDAYGNEKQVLFYGNEKENDGNKFQGFNGIGLVYVNETLNQHLRGLNQGIQRLSSARSPLMVMTQNPKGANHEFYQSFEKPKLATEEQIRELEFMKQFKPLFDEIEAKLIKDRNKEKQQARDLYLAGRKKTSIKNLSVEEQLQFQNILLDINYKYDSRIRNILAQDVYPMLTKDDYLYNKSMKKIVNYFRGEPNVNGIYNAYDFAYFHYTIDDNMAISDAKRFDFKSRLGKGTATYDQQALGIRRTSEGAIYPHFDEDNIIDTPLDEYDYDGKFRMLVIDKGFAHPTGMTDWFFDLQKGEGDCLQERPIDFNKEFPNNKSIDVIYNEAVKLIRRLNGRKVDVIVIDPSAPELIQYFADRNWNVLPASNRNWRQKGEDREDANIINTKDVIGIDLVSLAMHKKKLRVHRNCVETIKQIGSYAYVDADKSGKVKLPDLGDDQVVTIKYAWNTIGINPSFWGESEGENIDGNAKVEDSNDGTQEEEWHLEKLLQRQFTDTTSDSGYFFNDDDDGGWFNNSNGGWFN